MFSSDAFYILTVLIAAGVFQSLRLFYYSVCIVVAGCYIHAVEGPNPAFLVGASFLGLFISYVSGALSVPRALPR